MNVKFQNQFESDLVVIGGGIAGWAAATAGRKRGWSVHLVATGPGATGLTAGPWDFGVSPEANDSRLTAALSSSRWQTLKSEILKEGFDYSPAKISERCTLAEIELGYEFDLNKPFSLFTAQGTLRSAYGAPRSQAALSANALQGREVSVIHIKGLRSHVERLLPLWREETRRRGLDLRFRMETITLSETTSDFSAEHLAARLDAHPSLRDDLIDQLAVLKNREALLLPPIASSDTYRHAVDNVPIGEWIPVQEATVGARLQRTLETSLKKQGVEVFNCSETLAETAERRISRIACRIGADWSAFSAPRFVIATGRILSGGIEIGYHSVKETVLGLPLFTGRLPPIQIRDQIQTGNSPSGWTQLGAWVDERYRPRDPEGRVAYENVRICGSLIGGVDLSKHRLGLGFSDYTGAECIERFETDLER